MRCNTVVTDGGFVAQDAQSDKFYENEPLGRNGFPGTPVAEVTFRSRAQTNSIDQAAANTAQSVRLGSDTALPEDILNVPHVIVSRRGGFALPLGRRGLRDLRGLGGLSGLRRVGLPGHWNGGRHVPVRVRAS